MLCRIAYGAVSGYCTFGGCSSDGDCPAGFDCNEYGTCRAPEGCDAWIQTMGATCYSDYRCHDALKNGWCSGDGDGAPGVCTAQCSVDADCIVGTAASFVCSPGPSGAPSRCVRLP
jgi:hypothetical protein